MLNNLKRRYADEWVTARCRCVRGKTDGRGGVEGGVSCCIPWRYAIILPANAHCKGTEQKRKMQIKLAETSRVTCF